MESMELLKRANAHFRTTKSRYPELDDAVIAMLMQGDYAENLRRLRENQMIALNLNPAFSVETNHPTPKPYTINAEDRHPRSQENRPAYHNVARMAESIHNGPQDRPLRQAPHETFGTCSTCGAAISSMSVQCCDQCRQTGGQSHTMRCAYYVAAQVAIDELEPAVEPEQVQELLEDPEETYHDDFPDPDISPDNAICIKRSFKLCRRNGNGSASCRRPTRCSGCTNSSSTRSGKRIRGVDNARRHI